MRWVCCCRQGRKERGELDVELADDFAKLARKGGEGGFRRAGFKENNQPRTPGMGITRAAPIFGDGEVGGRPLEQSLECLARPNPNGDSRVRLSESQ